MDFLSETKYNPLEFEEQIYNIWLKKGCFKPNLNSKKEKYSVVMPPPNITGKLHMGHALDEILQDILIRFKKMSGFNTVWVPGVDHAAIATEVKIVESLRKKGLTKQQIGKEKFLELAFEWKEKFKNNIVNQLKKLGVSCDWSRQRFTMDSCYKEAVLKFFVDLYEKGYIYRGEKVVNWCFGCKTSISDAEVVHKEKNSKLYYVKYNLFDEDGFLEIATTRPETIFADSAVAVNPKDKRFKKYVGKFLIVPLTGKKIPIIADSFVDMEFGTGAVKITPGHDFDDFEVAKRHNLKIVNLLKEDATLNSLAGEFENLTVKKARKEVVLALEKTKSILKVEEIKNKIGQCYRCGTTIEPFLSLQWFVKMKTLKEAALKVVEEKEICFVPKRFEKIYFNWVKNVKDWCISRQLWWGHKIPAYYCSNCGHVNVSLKKPEICQKCESCNLKQDKDTLDTWFSSALWPYAVFGWPNEKAKDYKMFYPTNTLVTGYDIIFFWVFRMIFSAIYNTKKVPFKTVLIHGLVRDEQGRKMSKSLNNGIDPMEMVKTYGADALRFSLAVGVNAGNDLRYSEKKVKASRNFVNKLFNAARFILINVKEAGENFKPNFDEVLNLKEFKIYDSWILFNLNCLIKKVRKNIENFEISAATSNLYNFVWEFFCDWYIELFKIKKENILKNIEEKNSEEKLSENKEFKFALNLILFCLDVLLKLLHPFMPFITQQIYFQLYGQDKIILDAKFPEPICGVNFKKEAKDCEIIFKTIKELRNFRAKMNIKNSKKLKIFIKTKQEEVFSNGIGCLKSLAFCSGVDFVKENCELNSKNCEKIILSSAVIFVLLDGLVDKEKEKEKLLKEKKFLEEEIKLFEKKLSNKNFLNKAPKEIVEKEKEKLKVKKQKLEKILISLN